MHNLKVPEILASIRIGRDDAGAKKIVSLPIAAVLIDRRRTERHVDDAPLGVDGDESPNIDARSILPAVPCPRVVVFFAGTWNRVECPDKFPRVNVPRAHVTGRTLRRILLRSTSGDDQVAIDRWRRAEAVRSLQPLQNLGRVQVHTSMVAKRWIRFPCFRV